MTWRLISYRLGDAFENMAIDEAIFRETLKNNQPPTLRFFGWKSPTVSIGYFQELRQEINFESCRLNGVDMVRRMTGGKAVYHCNEVTYSLSAAKTEKYFPDSISKTYEIISRCLARGLSYLGITAHLAGLNANGSGIKRPMSPCCFSVPAGNELMVDNRKICGSAQIRKHGGFLQHGSLLLTFDPLKSAALIREPQPVKKLRSCITAVNEILPAPVDVETICSALRKGFCSELNVDFQEGSLTDAEQVVSRDLIIKYRSDAWTSNRKKG